MVDNKPKKVLGEGMPQAIKDRLARLKAMTPEQRKSFYAQERQAKADKLRESLGNSEDANTGLSLTAMIDIANSLADSMTNRAKSLRTEAKIAKLERWDSEKLEGWAEDICATLDEMLSRIPGDRQ